ncbi:nucleotide disphospho-sugar-binding domain-containing protein [Streptomyces sp. RPT161]|uniref:nucleotide disphospho-sugar-binding domain-containing protein n=1 Tax=Streptomyces sp. RPT161 TaxID=3015993 RepID=UPI0022B8583A|nr:nucleotide disphospho-sugar-binding domain-containing protein [Streptomyces sp. RPT161]
MRILFTTWSASAHLFPMVPLAWACRAAGHEVLVAVPSDCAPAVGAAGLTAVAVGVTAPPAAPPAMGGPRAAAVLRDWPADWPLRLAELGAERRRMLGSLVDRQLRIAGDMVPGLLEFARTWRPDLIVADGSTYAGTVVSQLLDVPLAAHLWGGAAVLRLEHSGPGGSPLPGYRHLFEHYGADPVHTPLGWLDPCPPMLQLPTEERRLSVRHVPYSGPAELPAGLLGKPARPRVCVTWEAGARPAGPPGDGPDPLLAAAGLLAADGLEVFLALGPAQRAALTRLPDGVRAMDTSALHLLLATCEAVAHQGSGGTAMTAAAVGTPQLVVSPRPEQMLTGERLRAVGAGRHLSGGDLTGDEKAAARVRDAVLDLLAGPARDAALALRDEVRSLPAPSRVASDLTELAARG